MRKHLLPVLICLLAATAAQAQPGGGRGGGRGGPGPSAPKRAAAQPNKLEIIGVVQAIDMSTGRVTITYEPVEALNWPHGTQPFPVAKSAMLDGVTVGEKVRFTVDSGEISGLKPF
jgi:Cu(I)/Ag(I) efflux system protein CusF